MSDIFSDLYCSHGFEAVIICERLSDFRTQCQSLTGVKGGSLHTDRDLSPSKVSQASGPTAASQRWNFLGNNSQAQGVSAPTSLK